MSVCSSSTTGRRAPTTSTASPARSSLLRRSPSDLTIEVTGRRVIDLCAGIGSLAFAYYHRDAFRRGNGLEIVCVEQNFDYVAVGRKVLPEATWILANVLELPARLGKFDCASANPPFGRIKSAGTAPRYTGAEFKYSVIDVASDIARSVSS